jgi:RNA polymerase sigma-70 factor (ECF subfamily)
MPLPNEDRTYTQRLSAAIDEAYQRYALGEPDAESNLYKAFQAQARNVAIHRLDWDRFEEFDRDVVHRAMIKLKGFRGQSKPSTWFFRVAVNEANRALRNHITDRERWQPLTITDEDGEERERQEMARVDNHDARIDLDLLERALPRKQADLMALMQEGYSLAEIARKTNEPLGTIRSRLGVVKEKLRKPRAKLKAR